MKTIKFFLLLVAFSCTEQGEPIAPKDSTIDWISPEGVVTQQNIKDGRIVIAQTNPQTGTLQLLADQLGKTFADGGPVKMFLLRKFQADYGFVRIGEDAKGNYRAEGFRTVNENGKISLLVKDNLVWYVLCTGECGLCTPTSNGKGCECPDIDSFGGKTVLSDETGLIIDDANIDYEPTQECTFGALGGLYPTKVFN